MEYTSQGQGTLNTVLGAVGTAGVLGGGGLLGNLFGGSSTMSGGGYVSRETFDLQAKLSQSEMNNAILSADLASEKKMVEVFNAANDKIMAVRDELNSYIRSVDTKVDANAAAQAVINCGFNSANAVLNSQVAQLMGMTKLGIPNSSLCPGFGNVTVSLDTGTTTTT